MKKYDCEHKNVIQLKDWLYCADCDDIIRTNITCEHPNIENINGRVYCKDCGNAVGYYGHHARNVKRILSTRLS